MKLYIILYNKRGNTWETLEFLTFEDFKNYLFALLEKEKMELVEPIEIHTYPELLDCVPKLACVLDKQKEIYYFFKKIDSKEIEEFFDKLIKITTQEIYKKVEEKAKIELQKNIIQVVELLNYITHIPKEKIKKEMEIFLEENKKGVPNIVKKFLVEIKKITDAIPPSLNDEEKFNKWWKKREGWLSKIREKIKEGDRKAKDELFKATFIFDISVITEKYKENYSNKPMIFLNLIQLGYYQLLEDTKKFDWEKLDIEDYYFVIGGEMRSNCWVIEVNWVADEEEKFPYKLAAQALLNYPAN